MEQIKHREFFRQLVSVLLIHVARGKGRQRDGNIHTVAQSIGKEIALNLCHMTDLHSYF